MRRVHFTKEHRATKRNYTLRWFRIMRAIPNVPLPDNELSAFQHFTDNLILRELGLPHDLKPDEVEIADAGVAALANNGD